MHFSVSYGTDQFSIHLHLVKDISAEGVYLQRQESWSISCVWCNCGLCLGLLPIQSTNTDVPRWFCVIVCVCVCVCVQCTLHSCKWLFHHQLLTTQTRFYFWAAIPKISDLVAVVYNNRKVTVVIWDKNIDSFPTDWYRCEFLSLFTATILKCERKKVIKN